MIEHAALRVFAVEARIEDGQVLLVEVLMLDEVLVSSRLKVTTTQLASPSQLRTLMRRELARQLGEVGNQLYAEIEASQVPFPRDKAS